MILHHSINYCHVLFKDVESAAETKDLVNRVSDLFAAFRLIDAVVLISLLFLQTTNFVLAFAKNITDMRSRVNVNGPANQNVQLDGRKMNGPPGGEFAGYQHASGLGRPRPPFANNQYPGYVSAGYRDNFGPNQAYMNYQNRDYERRSRMQGGQMRNPAYDGQMRRDGMGMPMPMQTYEDAMYNYERMQAFAYARPMLPPQMNFFDKGGQRYAQMTRFRDPTYDDPAAYRDDYNSAVARARMAPYGTPEYGMGVANVDWTTMAMQKAASPGSMPNGATWEPTEFLKLQQAQSQGQTMQPQQQQPPQQQPQMQVQGAAKGTSQPPNQTATPAETAPPTTAATSQTPYLHRVADGDTASVDVSSLSSKPPLRRFIFANVSKRRLFRS